VSKRSAVGVVSGSLWFDPGAPALVMGGAASRGDADASDLPGHPGLHPPAAPPARNSPQEHPHRLASQGGIVTWQQAWVAATAVLTSSPLSAHGAT